MNVVPGSVAGLALAVLILVLLVLRTKVHPLIAMILAACIAGITGGLSVDETVASISHGFGATLASIGLVIGLGVMMGRILEVSGAATQIAHSFVTWLGKGRESWAMALTGYFVSIPIFVDSAFVILFPIIKALARNSTRSLIGLGIALGGGLVVTHTLVPPTPGPLGAAGIFGVDVGAMMLSGMALAVAPVAAIVLYAHWLVKKYPGLNSQVTFPVELPSTDKPLPSVLLSWLPIALPIVLIFLKALTGLLPVLPGNSSALVRLAFQSVSLLGTPVIALSLSTILAVYTLMPFVDRKESNARLEEGLQSAGIILLVTGAGGALGAVVRDGGAGTKLAEQIGHLPVSPVMIPFFVATAVRLIQGSGTVACITAASITAPVLAQMPGMNMLFAAQSAVMGALCFSYFNDSLFWVVNRMLGITEVKQQILVWSVPTTLAWGTGGVSVALINLAFGSGGKWLDPLFPLILLAVIMIVAAPAMRQSRRPPHDPTLRSR